MFITASSFPKFAIDFVTQITDPKIVLIDGERLAQLMIEYNVGVTVRTPIVVKKVNIDYFGENEYLGSVTITLLFLHFGIGAAPVRKRCPAKTASLRARL